VKSEAAQAEWSINSGNKFYT